MVLDTRSQFIRNIAKTQVAQRSRAVTAPRGDHPYREILGCLLKQATIATARNRAREGMRRAVSDVESRSPGSPRRGQMWS